jgi:protocatechuate 3,4-dioxygenase beta subunit
MRTGTNGEVIVWQADNNGYYDHPAAQNGGPLDAHFRYFGRVTTDATGTYRLRTIVPAPYTFPGLTRAPHIHFRFERPGEPAFVTELYFDRASDAERRRADRVWGSRDPALRDSMIVALRPPSEAPSAHVESDAVWCRYDVTLPT